MKQYEIQLKGASAMLMNRLGKDILDEVSKIKKDELPKWEEDNWEKKVYKDKDGNVILPELVLRAVIIEAGKKHTSRCPKDIGRTWTNYLKSSVLITEPGVMDNIKMDAFGCMVNGNPSSGKGSSKVYKIRPRIEAGWTAKFIFTDLVERMSKEDIQGILETAGKFVGVGDWRPMHGRFYVEYVKEIN